METLDETAPRFPIVSSGDVATNVFESLISSTPLADASDFDTFIIKDAVQVLHENTLSATSSYATEVIKPAKKKIIKSKKGSLSSVSERPQTTHEKLKLAEKKTEVKYAHKLGELPKYLQKRKQQSAAASKISLAENFDEHRPKTAESSMRSVHKSVTKVQFRSTSEVQGDVKSSGTTNQSRMNVLMRDNEALKLECDKNKAGVCDLSEQLKAKVERIKSLEMKISRLQKEQKQNAENVERIQALEVEVANLKKTIESFTGRMKVKDERINKLTSEVEKLNADIDMQRSSYETLASEKNHLEALVESMKVDQKSNGEKSALVQEVLLLNEQIKKKSDEISTLKESIKQVTGENESLKVQSLNSTPKSSVASMNSEISKFQDQNYNLKKSEEKLSLEVRKLKSMLDDEKNTNISNEVLLNIRNEYIKNLQEADEINKIRIVANMKDIDDYRKQLREVEKFKLAHAEEKQNFLNLLDEYREKNAKLKGERNCLKSNLERKTYKYQKKSTGDH